MILSVMEKKSNIERQRQLDLMENEMVKRHAA